MRHATDFWLGQSSKTSPSALTDKFPDTDPLTVRFTDMHKWITELPGFSPATPPHSNESKLEAIQMAWHEEFEDRQN